MKLAPSANAAGERGVTFNLPPPLHLFLYTLHRHTLLEHDHRSPAPSRIMTDSTTGEPMGDSRAGIFRFTDLAAETRNQIYSLIATGDGKVYNLATFTAPAIARVSTQLRSESLPIIFAEASFYVNICSNLDVSPIPAALPSRLVQ